MAREIFLPIGVQEFRRRLAWEISARLLAVGATDRVLDPALEFVHTFLRDPLEFLPPSMGGSGAKRTAALNRIAKRQAQHKFAAIRYRTPSACRPLHH